MTGVTTNTAYQAPISINDYKKETNASLTNNNSNKSKNANIANIANIRNDKIDIKNNTNNSNIKVHNKKSKVLNWLLAPVAAPQQKNEPKTTTRLQYILGLGFVVAFYAFMFKYLKTSMNAMNGTSHKQDKLVYDTWQDINNAISLRDMALPKNLTEAAADLKNKIADPLGFVERGGCKRNSTILLYGPPGTGKTTFAKAIAKEFDDAKFASIDLSAIEGKFVGETEGNLNRIVNEICSFADKNPNQKVFVFLDEIDSFALEDTGSSNQQYHTGVLNALKKCLSEKLGSRNNIVTIGATNVDIDPNKEAKTSAKILSKPILDRFTNRVKVGNPTAEQFEVAIANHYRNCSYVENYLRDSQSPEVKEIAKKLADSNSSFRALETLFDTAASTSEDPKNLTYNDIINAAKKIAALEDKTETRKMGFVL